MTLACESWISRALLFPRFMYISTLKRNSSLFGLPENYNAHKIAGYIASVMALQFLAQPLEVVLVWLWKAHQNSPYLYIYKLPLAFVMHSSRCPQKKSKGYKESLIFYFTLKDGHIVWNVSLVRDAIVNVKLFSIIIWHWYIFTWYAKLVI